METIVTTCYKTILGFISEGNVDPSVKRTEKCKGIMPLLFESSN